MNLLVFLLQVSPQITKPPINQSVTEGHPVNFSCRASGVPTPTLDWVFNNDNLPFDINRTDHDGESLLELQSVTKEMKGTYRCEAKNKANTTSSSAILRVYGKLNNDIDDNDQDSFNDNKDEKKDDDNGEGS